LDRDQALSADLRKEENFKDAQRRPNYAGPSNRALQQQSNNIYQNAQPAPAPEQKQDVPAFAESDKLAAAAPPPKVQPAPPQPAAAARAKAANAPAQDSGAVVGGVKEKKALVDRQNAEITAVTSQNETVIVTGDAAVLATSMTQISGARILPVPGTKIIWKIDDDGRVRRTNDLGDSWKVQDTGTSATLFSGSAPSEKVCWLVGTFGTVLVTIDAGAHWTKATVPINSTIDRIDATDGRHAVVTLQSSTVQFETFDGGQNWSLVKKK
jgi:hypothetical protein